MKALSVRQPWASLIASGKKTIEVRSWQTHYRGPLLICAAKRPSGPGPVGVALAVVNLLDVRPFKPGDARAACFEATADDFAWVLGEVRRIDPFPVTGKLKMFDVRLPRNATEGVPYTPPGTRTKRRRGRRSRGNCE